MSHLNSNSPKRAFSAVLIAVAAASSVGCYAPLVSRGIPACQLPDEFRTPYRTLAPELNLASLTVEQPGNYILGPDDVLEVTIPDLYEGSFIQAIRARVMDDGNILLPLVGAVKVGGLNPIGAQEAINKAYANGIFANPRVSLSLAEKATVEVVVLGEVQAPGVYPLPKYSNDVGHALAAAGGFGRDAAEIIEVHRRITKAEALPPTPDGGDGQMLSNDGSGKKIVKIPLRGIGPEGVNPEDIVLNAGDVVVVPNRKAEVFFVVGQLDDSNLVRFTLGDRERELGQGLILPRDRDIDAVTAVAMAGYIDPIDSPTTVTVHRRLPNGDPLLITVDLIEARYDPKANVLIEGGDIIYVNPDGPWWFRRQLDRVVPSLFTLPYDRLMSRWILGLNVN